MPIDVKVRMMANCSEPSAEICVDGGFWNGPANAFYAHGENYYKTYPKGESWESRRSGEFTVYIKVGSEEAMHTFNANDFPSKHYPKGCELYFNCRCIEVHSGERFIQKLPFNISGQIKKNAKSMLAECQIPSATGVYHAATHTLFIANKGPITLDKLQEYPPDAQNFLMQYIDRNQVPAHAQLVWMMAQRGVDLNTYMVGFAIKPDMMLDPNSYTLNNGTHQQMHEENQTASRRGFIDLNGLVQACDPTWGSQERFHGQGDSEKQKKKKGVSILAEKRASANEYAMMCHALHNQRYVHLDWPSRPSPFYKKKCRCRGLGVVFEERARGYIKVDINIDGKGKYRMCNCVQCSKNFRQSDDTPYRIYDATFHEHQKELMYPGIAYNDLR
jgi:hypothetical protein